MTNCTREELVGALERLAGAKVLVIGDIILDRYVWGNVSRISPEAPVPVVEVARIEDRLGGASNVARNIRSLGAGCSLCGFVGDDEEGAVVLGLLEREGIGHDGVIADRTRPTCLKTRVIAQRQQIVRIDRESKVVQAVALREGFAAAVESQLGGVGAVIISDYGKGAVSEPVLRKLETAREQGTIALTTRPLVVDPHPANYDIYRGMSVVKPNRREAELATGLTIVDKKSALAAANALVKRWNVDIAMITLGEDGLLLYSRESGDGTFLGTTAREVFDVSGAGDTVTAVFATAAAAGVELRVAGDLANIAAGLVVSEVGTVAVDPVRLRAEISRVTESR